MATPQVPPIGMVASKWRRRVEGAAPDFEEGVRTKGARWEPAATAGAASYKAAISAADIQQRFTNGITKAGQAKYTRRALAVGPGRYAQAAPIAEPDFSAAVQPFLQAIGAVDLPARGPRGSAANYNRVRPIGEALNKLRLAGR